MKLLKKILESQAMQTYIPKIGSLLVAIVLWLYIAYGQYSEITFKIPITYKHLPSNMVVSEISHRFINVVVSGKDEVIRSIEGKDFQAIIDFKGATANGVERFPVQLIEINIPQNVNVVTRKVQALVKLENIISKQVIIEPKIVGNLKENRILGNVSVEPEYILARGAKSKIDLLEAVHTVDIDITDYEETIIKEVEIKKQYQLDGITLSNVMVKVNIPIYEFDESNKMEIAEINNEE